MDRFPQELAAALVGVFPRGNPSTDSWQQARGRSLEIGAAEGQNSDNPAMSAMFAMMRVLDGVEGSLRRVSGALGHAHEDQRQRDSHLQPSSGPIAVCSALAPTRSQ